MRKKNISVPLYALTGLGIGTVLFTYIFAACCLFILRVTFIAVYLLLNWFIFYIATPKESKATEFLLLLL